MNSSPMSQNTDVTLSLSLPPSLIKNTRVKPEERSVKLIQLLITCADHTSTGNLHHADICLRQITQLASTTGDSIQRLAARFASALANRIVKRWPGLYKALTYNGPAQYDINHFYSNFFRVLPYLGFAYAIINRTLVQAMSCESAIHIIDLGCIDPNLWTPFIREITNGPDGPPRLKITSISRYKEAQQKLKDKLIKEAESLKIPFQFNLVNTHLSEVNLQMLNIQSGESIAFTSILNLHVLLTEDDRVDSRFKLNKNDDVKESKCTNKFLEMVKSLSPKIILAFEQEANHNSSRLMNRFVEGLNYYSALFDSIDAAFGGFSCSDRTMLEEIFGREIEDIVAGEGLEREERHERYVNWAVRFGRLGFRPVRLWYDVMDEARKVVEGYGPGQGGFKVISEKGSLMICWRDRPIYVVSAWNCLS